MGGAGSFGLGLNPQTARNGPAWARIRNSRTLAGFRPNGRPFGLQSRRHLGTFEPAKSKGDLGTLGTLKPLKEKGLVGLEALALDLIRKRHVTARRGHASETGEPQQDSGPMGGHLVCRAGAI